MRALVGGFLVGYAAGLVVFFSIATKSHVLAGIGNAMAAGVAALLAGGAFYVKTTVAGVRRTVEQGRRRATIVALLVVPVPLALTVALTGVVARGRLAVLGQAGAIGLVAVVAVAVLAVSGALDTALAVRLGGALAGLAAVCLALPVMFDGSGQDTVNRVDLYRRTAIPVALVDGVTLEAPVPGWGLHRVEHVLNPADLPPGLAVAERRGSVFWQVGNSFVQLRMFAQPAAPPGDCPYAQSGEVCDQVGMTPGGAAIRGMRNPGDPAGSGYTALWVDVPGGRWLLTALSVSGVLNLEESVEVLSRLQLVDAERYVAVAAP